MRNLDAGTATIQGPPAAAAGRPDYGSREPRGFSRRAAGLGGSPRRTEPGARAAGRSARAEEVNCQGTLVTMMPGMNSSRLFSHSADWLCRRFSHQWPTTYSGMNTATMSRGLSRWMERT